MFTVGYRIETTVYVVVEEEENGEEEDDDRSEYQDYIIVDLELVGYHLVKSCNN